MVDVYTELGASTGATYVSVPGNPPNQQPAMAGPGGTGPGAQMNVHHAAILLIVGSFTALLVLGILFRRGNID
jgi:hypothetical protein